MGNTRKSACRDLNSLVADVFAPRVPENASILVGLSGGVDSVALLHVLTQLAATHSWDLSALHVHHGISPQADVWSAFCEKLCTGYGVPLQVEHVDIEPLRHLGIEAAARELRHAVLSRQPVDFIALAHHQDDQAETLLLQLLRGAGLKGAAAMPVLKRRSDGPSLLRPLLNVSRAELLAYAREHELQWVEDESNADASYPRNFLRHEVLPLLRQRFPASVATLSRSARHFAEADKLLDDLAGIDAHGAVRGEALEIARLASLDTPRARNLLRWFIHQQGALMPGQLRLEEMLRQALDASADAQVGVAWGQWEMHCFRGRLYVCRSLPEPDPDWRLTWNGEAGIDLPHLGGTLYFERCNGGGLSLEKLQSTPVTIQLRRGGERLQPEANRPPRTLQYLFQQHGIPPWQRTHWPLLYCGGQLVAVPGVAQDAAFASRSGEAGIRTAWMLPA